MPRKAAIVGMIVCLLCLQIGFPILFDHWVITIGKALPSFFTLGLTTVLIYKALRYPRGTAFTFFGLAQITLSIFLAWKLFNLGFAWVSLLIILTAIVFAPKSAKFTWRRFGVDKYYNESSEN